MPTLLTATIVLWVVGIILIVISVIIRPPSAADAEQPTLGQILARILSEMLDAFGKIANGPTWSDRFQGAGSLFLLLGIVTAGALFVTEVLLKSQTSTVSPTPSSSPSAAAS